MPVTKMRAAAILITAIIAISFRDHTRWHSVVLSIGFGHYLLSMWYARGKMSTVASSTATLLPMLAACGVGAAMYLKSFPLFVYFAAHHVCNEVYVLGDLTAKLPEARQRTLRATALTLHTLLYFAVLRAEPRMYDHYAGRAAYRLLGDEAAGPTLITILLGAMAVAYVAYAWQLFRVRRDLTSRQIGELSLFEIGGLGLVALTFVTPIRFLDVVCYHFVFWWFYPAAKMAAFDPSKARKYWLQMAVCVGLFLAVSPKIIFDYAPHNSVFVDQFFFWSYVHITFAFFLSAAHPEWIRRWFTPRSPARAASPARVMAPSVERS